LLKTDLERARDLIQQGIVYCTTDAAIELTDQAEFKARGNEVDCALLEFLQDNEVEIHKEVGGRDA